MDLYKIANNYNKSIDENTKKTNGIYYTPCRVVKFMVDDFLSTIKDDILKKNSVYHNNTNNISTDYKILDIACGCGIFFAEIMENILKDDDIYKILIGNSKNSEKHKDTKNVKDILDILYAIEKDEAAVTILKDYISKNYNINDIKLNNIVCKDALFDTDYLKGQFDYIIGNPPYVGHKGIGEDYSVMVRGLYSEVYKDKSDLYYCFFKLAVDLLKPGGICEYIVPRYFLESKSGFLLRKYIENNADIELLIDLRCRTTFTSSIGISPCIIRFRKKSSIKKQVDIEKYFSDTKVIIVDKENNLNSLIAEGGRKSNGMVLIGDSNWYVVNNEQKEIINSIKNKYCYRLGDIVKSNQGVITGCDKAFIINKDSEVIKGIDDIFIKRWIKSKDINKYCLKYSDNILVYTNDMKIEDFTPEYLKYINKYKEKLCARREVKSGVRTWYKLHWGRTADVFEKTKIIYPFKSRDNRFSLDFGNCYYSADIYSFTIRDEYKNIISYEYLLCLLNSEIYQKYMHSFLKKMGNEVYEYYPYLLLETKVFVDEYYEDIEMLGKKIVAEENVDKRNELIQEVDFLINRCLKK